MAQWLPLMREALRKPASSADQRAARKTSFAAIASRPRDGRAP